MLVRVSGPTFARVDRLYTGFPLVLMFSLFKMLNFS